MPTDGRRKAELTGTFAAVTLLRKQIHRKAKRRLAPAVAVWTATDPAALIAARIDPNAPRGARKAAAGLGIATTLYASGAVPGWLSANDANTAMAYDAGAAAGAHHSSGGAVALTGAGAAVGVAPPSKAQAALDAQIDGLAGDVADLYAVNPDATEADIATALALGAGIWAYQDMQIGQAFIDGSLALYAALGATTVNWLCCPPMCWYCDATAEDGPYAIDTAPGPLHPNCWCWVEAADGEAADYTLAA